MKARYLHPWDLSPPEAVALQRCLAARVEPKPFLADPQLVAGVDISGAAADGRVTAAVTVLTYPGLETVECRTTRLAPAFPYVPGLLSFRETPVLAPLLESLSLRPDIILVDGQGIAHPRRFGIACHVGILFDVSTIGCAKSKLTGKFEEPGMTKGAHSDLRDDEDLIGTVLRSRSGTRPIFVSVGHKIDLPSSHRIVMGCLGRYRIPEPTRRAHLAAAGRIAPFGPAKQC